MSLEYGNNQNPDLIAKDLEHRRSELNDTISQIGDQLDPSSFIQDVGHELTHYGAKATHYTADLIRRNPVASLLTLAGVASFFINEARSDSRRAYYSNQRHEGTNPYANDYHSDPYLSRQTADAIDARYPHNEDNATLTEKATQAASGLKESARHEGEKLVQRSKEVKHQVMTKGREVNDQAHALFTRNPLLVGGLGVLTGMAIGSLIPITRTEDKLLGEAHDRVSHRLAESGENLLHKAKEIGKDGLAEVKNEIKSEVDKLMPEENKSNKATTEKSQSAVRTGKTVSSSDTTAGSEFLSTKRI